VADHRAFAEASLGGIRTCEQGVDFLTEFLVVPAQASYKVVALLRRTFSRCAHELFDVFATVRAHLVRKGGFIVSDNQLNRQRMAGEGGTSGSSSGKAAEHVPRTPIRRSMMRGIYR
jgi:hypothetical protein